VFRRSWKSRSLQNYGPIGRPNASLRTIAEVYQDLQRLNLAAAWSRVKVPALILHGQYDWIMSRADSELIAQL